MRVSNRSTRLTLTIVVAGMTALGLAGPAAAAKSEPVAIDSSMYVAGPPPNTGTFTNVSGSDLICANGTVVDTRYVWGASRGRGGNPNGVPLVVDKTFGCPDGQLFFRLQIHGVFVSETFTWVVLGGTGAYADFHGQGDGWTDYSPFDVDGTVVNHYTGFLVP